LVSFPDRFKTERERRTTLCVVESGASILFVQCKFPR